MIFRTCEHYDINDKNYINDKNEIIILRKHEIHVSLRLQFWG